MNTEKIRRSVEENDRLLDLRKTIPALQSYIEDFKNRSASTLASFPFEVGRYGDHSDETFLQTDFGRTPAKRLTVFIHGGYWRAYSAEDFAFVADHLREAATRFISLNYSLCPTVGIRRIVHQINKALQKVVRDNPRYCIHLIGHSAGAHLAAMSDKTKWWEDVDLVESPVEKITLVSGIFDLSPVQRSFLQETVRLSDDDVEDLSPIHFKPASSCEYAIHAGGQETRIYIAGSETYCTHLRTVGVKANVTIHEEADHFSILCRGIFWGLRDGN